MCISSGRKGEAEDDCMEAKPSKGPVFSNQELELPRVFLGGFPSASAVKNLPQCRRCGFNPWVGKIPWSRAFAAHSSILTWKIPWTEEPGGLTVHGVAKSRTQLEATEHARREFYGRFPRLG